MYKIAIVGLGLVAEKAHLPSFSKNKKVKIVCLCDKNIKRLKKFGKKYNVRNLQTSYKNLLKTSKLDAVVISTNKEVTSKIAKYFVHNKIPILSEKPATLSVEDGLSMLKISKKKNFIHMVGYMKRFDQGIIEIKKILKNKKLGELKSVYYENFEGNSYKNPPKKVIKKLPKNKNKKFYFVKYLNSFSHSINLLTYLFGKIILTKTELNEIGEGISFFKSGKIKIIFNNKYLRINGWHEHMHLNFLNGKVLIRMPPPLQKNSYANIQIINFKNYKTTIVKLKKKNWSFKNQANAFVKLLSTNILPKEICMLRQSIDDIKMIKKIFSNTN